MFSSQDAEMPEAAQIRQAVARSHWNAQPVGYVFMVSMIPKGPLRATRKEAMQDAVEAREARVDLQYGKIFLNPLTWIAPIYP